MVDLIDGHPSPSWGCTLDRRTPPQAFWTGSQGAFNTSDKAFRSYQKRNHATLDNEYIPREEPRAFICVKQICIIYIYICLCGKLSRLGVIRYHMDWQILPCQWKVKLKVGRTSNSNPSRRIILWIMNGSEHSRLWRFDEVCKNLTSACSLEFYIFEFTFFLHVDMFHQWPME